MSFDPFRRKFRAGWLGPMVLALAGLLGLGAVCDRLFGTDTRPPDCRIVQPTDSTMISGKVTVRAEAYDTSGVAWVEFHANGVLIGTAYDPPYIAVWDATDKPDNSWHKLFCRAADIYDNVGDSDTVSVHVLEDRQRDVFHGAFFLDHNHYWPAGFTAVAGDTLAGDFRVLADRTLSRFIWLDAANYRQFRAGESHTPLLERVDLPEISVREQVATADSFYLVFLNTSGARVEVWARFALE